VTVVNDLYVGAFQQFYSVWQTQHKTIADSGFVLAGHVSLSGSRIAFVCASVCLSSYLVVNSQS